MPTLEELKGSLRDLQIAAELTDGSPEELAELDLWLEELAGDGGAIDQKLDGYIERIAAFEALADAKKARAKGIAAAAGSLQKKADWLRSVVLHFLEIYPQWNGRKLIAGTPRRMANPASVEIVDVDQLPDELVTIIPAQRQGDKRSILAVLKKGVEVPGARTAETTFHLRF